MTEEDHVPDQSKRKFMSFLGKAALGGAVVSQLGRGEKVKAQETGEEEPNSFNYKIESAEIGKHGILEIEFEDFDKRIMVDKEQVGYSNVGDYGPLGTHNVLKTAPLLVKEMKEKLPNLNTTNYDYIITPIGQFLPLENDKKFDIASSLGIGLKLGIERDQQLPFIGGLDNLNVGRYNKNDVRDAQENLNHIVIHESMHTVISNFPTTILDVDGKRLPISNGGHLIPQASVDENGDKYFHPHLDTIGGYPGAKFAEMDQKISPIHLLTLNLISTDEFNSAFEDGQPYVNRYTKDGKIEKVYYHVADLIEAYNQPANPENSQSKSLNELRALSGFQPVTGWKEGDEPKKIAIVPVAMFKAGERSEDTYIGNDKTMSENVDAFVEANKALADLLNTQTRGRWQAEIITG